MLPNVPTTYFTESEGVLAIARIVNQMHCIWRETPNADVGIDGQIEYVDDQGNATGHTIAVQVKSGKSYVIRVGDSVPFQVDPKHRNYWERYPLPVVVIIYDPDTDIAVWQDIRRVLRSEQKKEPIHIPCRQTLDATHRNELFESCGALGLPVLADETEILTHMVNSKTQVTGFPLSYFELFANGLIDIGRKLFFSMSLCMDIAEYNIEESGSEYGVGVGSDEYAFLDSYIRFLVSQSLIVFDYSDYLIDLYDRQMVSTFIAPLTKRGKDICNLARLLGGGDDPYELTEGLLRLRSNPFSDVARLQSNRAVLEKLSKKLGSSHQLSK